MEINKENIIKFLTDRDIRSAFFKDNGGSKTYLHKARHSGTTDIIYGWCGYNGRPLSCTGKLDGQGFIHYPTKTLGQVGYYFKAILEKDGALDESGYIRLSAIEIEKNYRDKLTAEIVDIASRQDLFRAAEQGTLEPQPVTDRWGRLEDGNDIKSMVQMSKGVANGAYAEHKTEIPYIPHTPNMDLGESDLLHFLDNETTFVKERADRFFADNLQKISNDILLNHLSNKYLNALNAVEGDHSKIRGMADIITCQKTVTLDIVKGDVPLTIKYDAASLKWCLRNRDRRIPDWHMPAQSNREFTSTYGRRAELSIEDIVAIRYGRNTLWSKQ